MMGAREWMEENMPEIRGLAAITAANVAEAYAAAEVEEYKRVAGVLADDAEKMRDWFMHVVPEWDKGTEKAIQKFNAALAEHRKLMEGKL